MGLAPEINVMYDVCIIKFPDKSWTKNSINGEVKKVRNSYRVNRQFWRVIFITFDDAISGEYYLSKTALAIIYWLVYHVQMSADYVCQIL